jgi:2-polyprenyl-3-methyl-5-hydroxy-6-metoxy-1,4-benzoquinol methylase
MPPSEGCSNLYEFVAERVLADFPVPGCVAADLRALAGQMTTKLESLGYKVVAVGDHDGRYEGRSSDFSVDFNESDFARKISRRPFQLVTAIEVLESVENPVGYLRNIRALLAPNGVAVLTVAKLDLLPAPVKLVLDHVMGSKQGGQEVDSPIF